MKTQNYRNTLRNLTNFVEKNIIDFAEKIFNWNITDIQIKVLPTGSSLGKRKIQILE